MVDSDEEDIRHERPFLNAKETQQKNKNITQAMKAAQTIAKEINSPQELEDGTLEMILFLTQQAISDLKELYQKNVYSDYGAYYEEPVSQYQMQMRLMAIAPEKKIKQVKELASNPYELINTLEQMRKSLAEKEVLTQMQWAKFKEIVRVMLKEEPFVQTSNPSKRNNRDRDIQPDSLRTMSR